MNIITITTQAELDALPKSFKEVTVIEIRSDKNITISVVRAFDNSSVTACGSSSVTAHDNSSVRAYDNSSVRACGSSSVTAHDNSSVRAYDNSSVTAFDNSSVTAFDNSSVDIFLCSVLFVSSAHVKIKSLRDNAHLTYKTRNANRPEILDATATITEYESLITPTFDQWLERGYVVADGIHQKLISQKTIGEVTIYETEENKQKAYVARKGDKFAHGKTIKEAKNDLRYKISDRDTSKFKSWKKEDVKPTDEIIEAYMTITGACSFGTKQFCNEIKLKDEYRVEDIFELTKGRFGAEQFKEFFV